MQPQCTQVTPFAVNNSDGLAMVVRGSLQLVQIHKPAFQYDNHAMPEVRPP